jgi:hypothetical protein
MSVDSACAINLCLIERVGDRERYHYLRGGGGLDVGSDSFFFLELSGCYLKIPSPLRSEIGVSYFKIK